MKNQNDRNFRTGSVGLVAEAAPHPKKTKTSAVTGYDSTIQPIRGEVLPEESHGPGFRVRLTPFDRARDLPLLAAWLSQPHVRRWWGDPVKTLEILSRAPTATCALIEFRGRAVGFICWQTASRQELREAGLNDLPSDLVDVDLMVGDPAALGCGVGPAALHQLLRRLRRTGVSLAGLATAAGNSRAARAFAKAGFRPYRDFQEAGETYRYFVREIGAAV